MAVKPLTRSEWQIVFGALSMKLLTMSSKAALLSFAISYFPFITPLLQTQHAEKMIFTLRPVNEYHFNLTNV